MIEIMGGDQGIRQYSLGYDEYVEARERAKQAAFDRYEQYEKEKKRLERSAKSARVKANSAGSNRSSSDNDKLSAHFRKEKAASGLAGTANSISTRIGQLDEPERPEEDISLSFLFKEQSTKKLNLLSVTNLEIDYGNGQKIGPISLNIRSGDKVLLTGENGAGKTSIIRGIMNMAPVSSGSIHTNKDAGLIYIDQNQTLPLPSASALDNLRYLAPSLELHDAINLLIRFNIKKDTLQTTPGSELSGGERAKVLLAGMTANDAGLLILDEPTNNLDIATIEALEAALKQYRGGTLLVSHDRDFIKNVGITESISIAPSCRLKCRTKQD